MNKTLQYIFVYTFFVIAALLAIVIVMGIRGNVYEICKMFKVNSDIVYIFMTWGTYSLFLPYVLFIALIEPYLNKSVKIGQVKERILRVVYIEGGLALFILVVSLINTFLGHPPRL